MTIEICTTSLSSIENAQNAGANRLELCENYLVGGVTPNIEFFEKSLEVSKIPIHIFLVLNVHCICFVFRLRVVSRIDLLIKVLVCAVSAR